MGSVFEEIIRTQTPSTPSLQEGLIWVNILVRFNTSGKAEILRVFSKPAKESTIKTFSPKKQTVKKLKIEKADDIETLF